MYHFNTFIVLLCVNSEIIINKTYKVMLYKQYNTRAVSYQYVLSCSLNLLGYLIILICLAVHNHTCMSLSVEMSLSV